MPIIPPDGEAVIYRNFIEGAGARAIGVGYPMQRNIAYDADQMRLALVWQGAFIDAARHWNGRGQGFQPPLGYNVYTCVEGVPLAHLESSETPWPDSARKTSQQRPDNGYVFKGYQLDERRYPHFRYLFEGMPVTDFCFPVGAMKGQGPRLVRSIKIKGAGTDLYFRAAQGDCDREERQRRIRDRRWQSPSAPAKRERRPRSGDPRIGRKERIAPAGRF